MLPSRPREADQSPPELDVSALLGQGGIGNVAEQPLAPPRTKLVGGSVRTADIGQRGADFRSLLLRNLMQRGG